MIAEYTTEDGYTLAVHSSLYLDYGLSVSKDGAELFYRPCMLSAESYGSKPAHPEWSWRDAEQKQAAGIEAFMPWTAEDWQQALEDEAWELLDCAGIEA